MSPTDILTINAILQHKTPFPKPINFNDADWVAWDYLQKYPNSYQLFIIKPIRKIQQCTCYTCGVELWILEQFVRDESVVFCSCSCAEGAIQGVSGTSGFGGRNQRIIGDEAQDWNKTCRECNLNEEVD